MTAAAHASEDTPTTAGAAPHVVLIGNYEPDRQQSMLRFARSLRAALAAAGASVELIQPERRYGPAVNPHRGLGKWLAYVDKFILFPRLLRRRVAAARVSGRPVVFHICDHSNATLLSSLRGARTSVTCHDMLAILGALGLDPWCPASGMGKRLQSAILRGLRHAGAAACDSTHTRQDFERLTGRAGDPLVRTILLPLNDAVGPALPRPAASFVQEALPQLAGRPYLLHVGSGLPRKNRIALVHVLAHASARTWPGCVVFAGEPAGGDLLDAARAAGLADRVFSVAGPSPQLLRALYEAAHALLFPSHGEGFGYPILEAQACGCPVICSDTTSLPEVGGEGARYHDVADHEGMAQTVLDLAYAPGRARQIALGTANLARFGEREFAESYLRLFSDLLASRPAPR